MRAGASHAVPLTVRKRLALLLALLLTLSVFSWLQPTGGTSTDVQMDNAERYSRNVPNLYEDQSLDKCALAHSEAMAAKGTIWHDTSTQTCAEPWSAYGENVGMGDSLTHVHEAFMASPDHRRNILFPSFRNMGAGIVEKGGYVFVTEIFVLRPSVPSKAPQKPQEPRTQVRRVVVPPRPVPRLRRALPHIPQIATQSVDMLILMLTRFPR